MRARALTLSRVGLGVMCREGAKLYAFEIGGKLWNLARAERMREIFHFSPNILYKVLERASAWFSG